MKQYPSIPRAPVDYTPNVDGYAFLKYDGSNLRFEWDSKRSWHKFGTRHRLFDSTDPIFGGAISLFRRKYGDSLAKIFSSDYKVKKAIAFCEFFGPHSFAGHHLEDDPKDLILFDVNIDRRGLLGPEEFLEKFGHLEVAELRYQGPLDNDFIQDTIRGRFNSEWEEGLVCKWGEGHDLHMMKVKTRRYLDKLKNHFGERWEEFQ